jgi:RNase H-fold protein (predicted Holliday junction resolvase)
MTILALDVGNRRIGVAISDPTELLARPLTVISRRDDATALAAIRTIVEANGVTTIVVGVPLATDGTVGEQARRTFEFTRYLRRASEHPGRRAGNDRHGRAAGSAQAADRRRRCRGHPRRFSGRPAATAPAPIAVIQFSPGGPHAWVQSPGESR